MNRFENSTTKRLAKVFFVFTFYEYALKKKVKTQNYLSLTKNTLLTD